VTGTLYQCIRTSQSLVHMAKVCILCHAYAHTFAAARIGPIIVNAPMHPSLIECNSVGQSSNCQPSNRFNVLPDQAMPRPLPTSAYPSHSSSLISRPATPPQMSVPQWSVPQWAVTPPQQLAVRPVTWTPSPPQAQMPKLDSDARSHVNPPGLPYIQPQGHLTHVPQGSFRSQSPQQASHSFVMAQGRAPANRVLMGHQRPVPQQLASQWQQSGWQNQGFMQELHAEQARPPQQNTAGQQHHQGINQANAFYATPPGIFRHITELCVCDCAVCLRECVCVRVRVCVCTIATYDILLRCK